MKNDAHTNLGRLACGADHYGVHRISHKCPTKAGWLLWAPIFCFFLNANSLSDAGGSPLKRIIAGAWVCTFKYRPDLSPLLQVNESYILGLSYMTSLLCRGILL